jgi:hypothetical protein
VYVENMNVAELPSSSPVRLVPGQKEMALLDKPSWEDLSEALREEEETRSALVSAKVGVKKAKNAHDHAVTALYELGHRIRTYEDTADDLDVVDGSPESDEPEG